jgi:GNAT superfamily N-acetyltransferase
MIRELAGYEKALDAVKATEESLAKTLQLKASHSDQAQPSPGFAKTLLIRPAVADQVDGIEVAGMALFFYNYSTWHAAPGIYLEDLFVRPQYRRRGYASMLLKELAKQVKEVGGARLEWSCLKWNEPSLKFYDGLGAKQMNEWVGLRVDGDALDKLAEQEIQK